MTRGLLAPLSPQEEIALRRIALGSLTVDDTVVSTLLELALIQRTTAATVSRRWGACATMRFPRRCC